MNDIYQNLKTKTWDTFTLEIPSIKSYINVDTNSNISFRIIVLENFNIKVREPIDHFDISLINLVTNLHKKSTMFELPLFDKNINECDVLVGFLPNPNRVCDEDVYVKVSIKPIKKSCFSNNKYIELIIPIKKNILTPFLYDAFPFPRIGFANYEIKFQCNSSYPPRILCANFQSYERKQLYSSNICIPINYKGVELLFPSINTYRKAPHIILENISNYSIKS